MRRDTADRPHSPPLRGTHNKTLFIFSQIFWKPKLFFSFFWTSTPFFFCHIVTCIAIMFSSHLSLMCDVHLYMAQRQHLNQKKVTSWLILFLLQVCRPSTCTTLTLTTTPAQVEAPSMVTRMAPPGLAMTTSLTSCPWCARMDPPGPVGAPRCQWRGAITPPGCIRPLLHRPWPAPCLWSVLLTTPRCRPRCPGPPPPMVTPSTTWPPPMMAWCPATSYLPVMVTTPHLMTVSIMTIL